jgi:hypothetical protein
VHVIFKNQNRENAKSFKYWKVLKKVFFFIEKYLLNYAFLKVKRPKRNLRTLWSHMSDFSSSLDQNTVTIMVICKFHNYLQIFVSVLGTVATTFTPLAASNCQNTFKYHLLALETKNLEHLIELIIYFLKMHI